MDEMQRSCFASMGREGSLDWRGEAEPAERRRDEAVKGRAFSACRLLREYAGGRQRGADAVYIGGSRFGARAYAENLEEEAMVRAIDFVHLHGCRIYMTVNTLVKEQELSGLYAYLKPYYEAGLDAVLVQDLGVFSYLRRQFPQLPLHISTQMTVTGSDSARMLKEMGAVRVVPARELSLEEIRAIAGIEGLEAEPLSMERCATAIPASACFPALSAAGAETAGGAPRPAGFPLRRSGTKKRWGKRATIIP